MIPGQEWPLSLSAIRLIPVSTPCPVRAIRPVLNLAQVKVRFQSPHIASKYRSTLHAFLTIVREERIRGLYRGIAAPLVRPTHDLVLCVCSLVSSFVRPVRRH